MGKSIGQRKKEQKERQRQREKEHHDAWLKQFRVLGVNSEEELHDLVFGGEDCVDLEEETIENGFPCYAVWETYYDKNAYPETIHISKCQKKYIVWKDGCLVGDYAYETDDEFIRLFDSLGEAREYRGSQPKGEDTIMTQIHDCKDKLGDDKYYFKIEQGGWPGQYNITVFYDRDLIAENVRSFKDIGYFKDIVARYKSFKKSLENRGAILYNVSKLPREWSRNERFYGYDILYNNHAFTFTGQILSSTQHQVRESIDFFPEKELEKFIREVDAGEPFPGLTKKEKAQNEMEWKNYQRACEAAYQGIPHGEGVEAIPLTGWQKTSLFEYLNGLGIMNHCDNTLKHTVEWVIDNIEEEQRPRVLETIRQEGGLCDCEVVMNYLLPQGYVRRDCNGRRNRETAEVAPKQ